MYIQSYDIKFETSWRGIYSQSAPWELCHLDKPAPAVFDSFHLDVEKDLSCCLFLFQLQKCVNCSERCWCEVTSFKCHLSLLRCRCTTSADFSKWFKQTFSYSLYDLQANMGSIKNHFSNCTRRLVLSCFASSLLLSVNCTSARSKKLLSCSMLPF